MVNEGSGAVDGGPMELTEPFEVIRDRAGGPPARPAGRRSLVTP